MDESITNIRQLYIRFVRSGGADAEALRQMRLWRATIRGDRAGYEKANAELRATFEAVAAFALQVALTALLTPAAAAIFRGAEGALAAARAVKMVRGIIVNTVARSPPTPRYRTTTGWPPSSTTCSAASAR